VAEVEKGKLASAIQINGPDELFALLIRKRHS